MMCRRGRLASKAEGAPARDHDFGRWIGRDDLPQARRRADNTSRRGRRRRSCCQQSVPSRERAHHSSGVRSGRHNRSHRTNGHGRPLRRVVKRTCSLIEHQNQKSRRVVQTGGGPPQVYGPISRLSRSRDRGSDPAGPLAMKAQAGPGRRARPEAGRRPRRANLGSGRSRKLTSRLPPGRERSDARTRVCTERHPHRCRQLGHPLL